MQLFKFRFKALGCDNEVQLYSDTLPEAQWICNQIIESVGEIERKYSRYLPKSVVSKINLSAGLGERIEVDAETAALIDYAKMCFENSEGLFDLTSGILRKAWDFTKSDLPNQSQIDELLNLVGWHNVEWSKPYLRLKKTGMELDFGGIGKEYAVDKAIGLVQETGAKNCLINFGGDIRAIGFHLNGHPWTIGISHPRDKNSVITSVKICNQALASSGDYERFIEVGGKRYCHILNPKTGWPIEEMQSVSVLSESCLVAGSAATIAMLLGDLKGERFLRELKLSSYRINAAGKISDNLQQD